MRRPRLPAALPDPLDPHVLLLAGYKKSEGYYQHGARLDDYLWVAEDGMKMQGYNGSQCWDTSFAVQVMGTRRSKRAFSQSRERVLWDGLAVVWQAGCLGGDSLFVYYRQFWRVEWQRTFLVCARASTPS